MIFLKYLFIFSLFSIVGWILEFIYRSIISKKIVNPGLMTGCVLPLYGFGAIILNLICILFDNIHSNYKIIIIFVLSTIILSLLEFISGYFLYKFMHLKLWDYTNNKFNIKGFICLSYSLIWGILSLIFYFFIYKWINPLSIILIKSPIVILVLGIYLGIFIVDLCVSIDLLSKLRKYAVSIKEIINIEKLKIDSRMKVNRKKFFNAIYPYVSINRFIKDKLKK